MTRIRTTLSGVLHIYGRSTGRARGAGREKPKLPPPPDSTSTYSGDYKYTTCSYCVLHAVIVVYTVMRGHMKGSACALYRVLHHSASVI